MSSDTPDVDEAGPNQLVLLDPADPGATLRAVLRDPAAATGDLCLLLVQPTAEYEARRRGRLEAGLTGPYSIDGFAAEAERTARRAGEDWLDPVGRSFEALGAVGRPRDHVASAVAARGVSRVYAPSGRPAWWRRLLGAEAAATALARALPDSVTVVPVAAAGHSRDGGLVDPLADQVRR